ncbi:MAG: A/G-specific adenine glycosylase [Lachnospiraceae bacterium]|nr:A/G-specific adenine glycosylase [Lachnospiraceae bacterium]
MFELEHIVNPLLKWFHGHARVLPWREEPTPYRVWISEIMLQQTRVEAVKPYFERFLAELPDVSALASVEEDRLLKLWEGLGYYNRARNLKKAAVIIRDQYQGELPSEVSLLMQLPGIGSYTAGAIASIAYQKPYPAVDGNVLRVISRVMEDHQDVLNQSVKKQYEESLQAIMPKDQPGAFNQALMELGAMVCVPNGAPRCEECPWNTFCLAKKRGCIAELPHKAKKKPRVIEEKTVLLIQDEKKVAIRKRPNKGLLAGLYEFPMLEGICTRDQVIHYVEQLGFKPIYVGELERSKHIFTHKEWHMLGYTVRVDELDRPGSDVDLGGFELIETRETEADYPIPAAFVAYTRYLNIKLGNSKYQ